MDELDAICRKRGGRGDSGTGDSVVNQLLSKMQGVDELHNILIIGMTNRKDMIDDALLRPGRFGVHLEINLPDEHGRRQIFDIHTATGRANGFYDEDVDLACLAAMTKNYSGAEIKDVVTSALSWAMKRAVKGIEGMNATPDASLVHVTMADFENALVEVAPAFGVSREDFESMTPNGIVEFGPRMSHVLEQARAMMRQASKSEKTRVVSFALAGVRGSGRTSLAARLATESGFELVKLVSPEKLVGLSEHQRLREITNTFEDAYKSTRSVVVVDDLERLIDFVPSTPERFSNALLQTLLVLLNKSPPHGRRLCIIVTINSGLRALRTLGCDDCLDAVIDVPLVTDEGEYASALAHIGAFNDADDDALVHSVAKRIAGQAMPIKRLIMLCEMAKQMSGGSLAENFISCVKTD